METFHRSAMDRHPTDLAMTQGRPPGLRQRDEEGRAWGRDRIKQLTGGDQNLRARGGGGGSCARISSSLRRSSN